LSSSGRGASDADADADIVVVEGAGVEGGVGAGSVRIGGVEVERDRPTNLALVPHVLFYDIPKHRVVLRELFKVLSTLLIVHSLVHS